MFNLFSKKYNVSPGVVISHPGNTHIGKGTSIGYDVLLFAGEHGSIIIGDQCLIGHRSILRAENHRFERTDIPIIEQGLVPGKIVIDNDVWIGANAIILPDVHISKGAIVGAGSVVTKDIPEYTIVAGNPAEEIRHRTHIEPEVSEITQQFMKECVAGGYEEYWMNLLTKK